MLGETFQVVQPLEGPRTRAEYFAPRAIGGLRPCARLGMGTAGLGGALGPEDRDEAVRVLHDAWDAGYLLVDTSPNYAHAEEVLGEGLKAWKGEPPVVCTKLEGYASYAPPAFAKNWRASLTRQFDASTRHFGGRRIDALAMHDAEAAATEFQVECHAYLADLLSHGEIGAAGLGGGGPSLQPRYLDTGQYRYAITFLRLGALSLQSLRDTVPACHRTRAAVVIGSPIFMGFLGPKFEQNLVTPPDHVGPVYVERAKSLKRLAAEAGLRVTQLALRFAWSMPHADFVLTGSGNLAAWRDTRAAFEAGPLPTDLYRQVWQIAQTGAEPVTGG